MEYCNYYHKRVHNTDYGSLYEFDLTENDDWQKIFYCRIQNTENGILQLLSQKGK